MSVVAVPALRVVLIMHGSHGKNVVARRGELARNAVFDGQTCGTRGASTCPVVPELLRSVFAAVR